MGTKVVFDTNVLISALGWNAKPEACLEQVFNGSTEGYISPEIVDELEQVMEYPRFEFTADEKQSFLQIILASFHMVEPALSLEVVEEDPDDDKILECAVAADADYIISGDSHLTDLDTFRTIEIVTPAKFLNTGQQDSGT